MKRNFRLKLMLTLVCFAVVISFTIAISDHIRFREQLIQENERQINEIEEIVSYSLTTIEKAYYLFGEDLANQMKEASHYLLDLYEANSNFNSWDFQKLKQNLGFDIYIVDENHVVIDGSFKRDHGLDFTKCCAKIVPILEERRKSGEFYSDGLDIEQHTGKIKKYSYMATHDHKYLIQLGYSLEKGTIFQHFNFINTMNDLVQRYESVHEINILNIGGLALGDPHVSTEKLTPIRRDAFEKTLSTSETVEVVDTWNGHSSVYRYVNYLSAYDTGATKQKVIEIVYNNTDLQHLLQRNLNMFLIRLAAVLMITVFLSLFISRWFARPIYLAFHDCLTGLKNRVAFEEMLEKTLKTRKGKTALLMIDLDNFKTVNDTYGHDSGDKLLKGIGQHIQAASSKDDTGFRLAGDEFVLLMPETDQQEAEAAAKNILVNISRTITSKFENKHEITASIGIAFAPDHGTDAETLRKKADIALYSSKKKGKNQYQIYGASNQNIPKDLE